MGSITSDEINFLVYRYLQESGFVHSSFTFGCESFIARSNINGANVAPGALISYLQKGLQYLEIEHHLKPDGSEVECEEPFSLLATHECKVKSKKKSRKGKSESGAGASGDDGLDSAAREAVDTSVPPSAVAVLEGHESEVFICAWNPSRSMLASGSGDSTARVWNIPPGPNDPEALVSAPTVLEHVKAGGEKSKDVTTLDWNRDGTLLATGSVDGLARVWDSRGELLMTLDKHSQAIFSLKWNKAGNYLLSGSVDTTAVIWDAHTGDVKQQFQFHSAPTLDVDWKDNNSFATCSTDRMIYVCELGRSRPVKQFEGHQDEVNAIKWDPTGTILASCSDDHTAKIWSLASDQYLHDLKDHTKEIYTIKWSPTGPGTDYPNRDLVLASASFDNTIKLWDIKAGMCRHNLAKHRDPIYSVAFSPTGEYLASGSSDQWLYIWSVKDGSLVKKMKGNGGIFEVCWNSTGDKVAACFSNSTVCVVDFRM